MRQINNAGFTRHIRESEANVARTCRAQQGDVTFGPLCIIKRE
jgi:hypothetical protein